MNKEVKTLWLEALRSDKYKQGKMCLGKVSKGNNLYCCLGVLCEIAHEHGIVTKTENTQNGLHRFVYDGQEQYLPPTVVKWAGLAKHITQNAQECPIVYYGKHEDRVLISELNDFRCCDFNEIADIIEEQL